MTSWAGHKGKRERERGWRSSQHRSSQEQTTGASLIYKGGKSGKGSAQNRTASGARYYPPEALREVRDIEHINIRNNTPLASASGCPAISLRCRCARTASAAFHPPGHHHQRVTPPRSHALPPALAPFRNSHQNKHKQSRERKLLWDPLPSSALASK